VSYVDEREWRGSRCEKAIVMSEVWSVVAVIVGVVDVLFERRAGHLELDVPAALEYMTMPASTYSASWLRARERTSEHGYGIRRRTRYVDRFAMALGVHHISEDDCTVGAGV
jgi:hypothetical protein